MKRFIPLALLFAFIGATARAQDVPADYQQVLTTLGKSGDYKANVLKVNIPRNDLNVTVANVKTPTPFGFGGWVAMTKGTGATNVMMGDLVLHGQGTPADLARKLKPAIDLIGKGSSRAAVTPPAAPAAAPSAKMDTAKLAKIVGTEGEQSGDVYKITIGRDDLKLTEMGAPINARMGLNTWAAFVGTDQNAAIAGDVAMLAGEVTPVLKALRKNGLDVVAIHHHMTGTQPTVFFLHYWGTGPADKLATGFKAALAELGKSPAATSTHH